MQREAYRQRNNGCPPTYKKAAPHECGNNSVQPFHKEAIYEVHDAYDQQEADKLPLPRRTPALKDPQPRENKPQRHARPKAYAERKPVPHAKKPQNAIQSNIYQCARATDHDISPQLYI